MCDVGSTEIKNKITFLFFQNISPFGKNTICIHVISVFYFYELGGKQFYCRAMINQGAMTLSGQKLKADVCIQTIHLEKNIWDKRRILVLDNLHLS